jgi:hypothetical protein
MFGVSCTYSRRTRNVKYTVGMSKQLVLQAATPCIIKSNATIHVSGKQIGTVLNPQQFSDA